MVDLRDLVYWARAGVALVFFLWIANYGWAASNMVAPYYTSWDFHECYAATFDAPYCTETVIKTVASREEMGYSVYPPLAHVLSRFIPLPVPVALRVLMTLVFVSLFVVLAVATKSVLAPIALFYASPHLWATFLRGGTLPFFLFLLLTLIAFCFWNKLGRRKRLGLLALALVSHTYGALFFVSMALVFRGFPLKHARSVALFGAVAVSAYLHLAWPYPEYRGWLLIILLSAVYFGAALSWIESQLLPAPKDRPFNLI